MVWSSGIKALNFHLMHQTVCLVMYKNVPYMTFPKAGRLRKARQPPGVSASHILFPHIYRTERTGSVDYVRKRVHSIMPSKSYYFSILPVETGSIPQH